MGTLLSLAVTSCQFDVYTEPLSVKAKECQNQLYEGKDKRFAATSFALVCCQMLLINIGEKNHTEVA